MKNKVAILVILFSLLLMCLAVPAYAAQVPDGFAGVPWGASRAQVKQILSERGWKMVNDEPQRVASKGSFNGINAQLTFSFEGNGLVGGTVIMGVQPIKNISASAYAYKNLVESLTKKYGPPSGTSEDNLTANSGWSFVDTDTKDEYTILAMFTKYSSFMDPDYPANAELVGVTVCYSASSLAKRLKDKGL